MARLEKTYDLSQFGRLDIKSITMREAGVNDTLDAAARSLPPDGKMISQQEFGIELRIQQVSGAIVAVNGKRVEGTFCSEYREWSHRTRKFVDGIYDFLNDMTEEEAGNFSKLLQGSVSETLSVRSNEQ